MPPRMRITCQLILAYASTWGVQCYDEIMNSRIKLRVRELTGRMICRSVARFFMLVFPISVVLYATMASRGGCGYHSVGTFTSLTIAVAFYGVAMLAIAVIFAPLLFFLEFGFDKLQMPLLIKALGKRR